MSVQKSIPLRLSSTKLYKDEKKLWWSLTSLHFTLEHRVSKKDGKEQFRKAHSRRSRSKIYEKECMYNKYTWKTLSSLFLFILCTSITTTTLVAENKNHSFMYVAFANSKHIPLSSLFSLCHQKNWTHKAYLFK